MSTEITKREVAGAVALNGGKPAYEGDATDILIPRVYAAQKTSKVIEDSQAKLGQLVRSTTNEVLGGLGTPVPVIPLKQWKTWLITEGGKFKGTEPFTAANANLPFTFTENGREMKRERVLNFYVLLPTDIKANLEARRVIAETGEMPDKLVSLVPCQITFKSTSYKAGRTLATHFAQMEDLGAKCYMRWLNLDSEIVQNDKGKFSVLKVTEGGAVKDKEQLAVCERWFNILKTAAVKVDDAGLDDEVMDISVTTTVETSAEF
jgi:hypothetical protein